MSKPIQKPKVIKIDAHIKKSTKETVPGKIPAKRGRPTNASKLTENSTNQGGNPNPPRIISSLGEPSSPQQPVPPVSPIVVQFDTTEQAKAFIQGPFAIVAMMLSDNDMALSKDEADIIGPVFKPVYDEDILPSLGKNSKYVNLGAILAGVIGKKFMLYRAKHANDKKQTYYVEPAVTPPQPKAPPVSQPPAGATVQNPFKPPIIPVDLVK